jgi:hypothetical protein
LNLELSHLLFGSNEFAGEGFLGAVETGLADVLHVVGQLAETHGTEVGAAILA